MIASAREQRKSTKFETCVFYADVCDYTAHLIANEAQAIENIVSLRRLITGTIERHTGHVVDQSGDSVLAWFEQPGAAVECAISILLSLTRRPAPVSGRPYPQIRIGIASGEVLRQNREIYGKVVTDAARLQSLAKPGGIVISPEVRLACSDLVSVRSADPVRALLKPDEPVRYGFEISVAGNARTNASTHRSFGHAPMVMIVPLITLPGNSAAMTHAAIFLQLFLECIHREKAEAAILEHYPQALRAIGAEIAAPAYLVAGGAHTDGGHAILSISILYGANRRLIAADRISIDTGADGFSALQAFAEGAFRSIVRNEIDVALRMKTVPKGAFQLYSKARNALGSFTPAGVHQAISSLEDCLSLEPDFARGWALLGKAYSIAWRFSWATKARDALAESVHLTDRALAMAPRDPVIMAQSAFALKWAGEQVRAQHESDEALALGLSEPDEVGELAVILQNRGQTSEAISLLTRSLRASPDDPDHRLWTLGDILFSTKRYDEALNALRRVRNAGQASRLAAACSARLGLDPDRYVREVLAIQPDFSVRRWIGIQPPATGDELDDYSSALLEAGLPP